MYISDFSISGFRSLKDVKISKMLPLCIFHGLNNSGKSNILAGIETIFQRKVLVDETTVAETTKHHRLSSFWQGRILNFRDNFYGNQRNDIKFSVSVILTDAELAFLEDILAKMHNSLAKPGHEKILNLTGRIKYVDEESAEMTLERCVFNKKHVVFEVDDAGKKSFFPKILDLSADQRLGSFEKLMTLLSDSFALLPADRFLTSEQTVHDSNEPLILSPKTFKNWLFQLSLNRSGHSVFEEVKKMFGSAPFSLGEIGFSEEGGEIEIMVQEPNVRLPISRLGSGHQQILYIIANIVITKKKMLGIEELEINLSPTAQKVMFEKLKKHIYESADLVTQVIITSHSDYFRARKDVRCYGVDHDGTQTTVAPWTEARGRQFFSLFGARKKKSQAKAAS